jgi:hypothetical protein
VCELVQGALQVVSLQFLFEVITQDYEGNWIILLRKLPRPGVTSRAVGDIGVFISTFCSIVIVMQRRVEVSASLSQGQSRLWSCSSFSRQIRRGCL